MFQEAGEMIESIRASQMVYPRLRGGPRNKTEKPEDGREAMESFCSEYELTKSVRLNEMAAAIFPFRASSQMLYPTSWVKTIPEIEGMVVIDLKNKKTSASVNSLCKKMRLKPPKGFMKKNSVFYGHYAKSKLVSVVGLCIAQLNRKPGSIAICIDLIASIDTNHSCSVAIESLKKNLRKRKSVCVLFAQVANTESAQQFWKGKLAKSKRASIMSAMFSKLDKRYDIYEDAADMAMFYE